MEIHNFTTSKTARYATHGRVTSNTKQIWFVCHGYGQLAPYFIKNFRGLDPEEHFVVAPEALSRFYLQGFGGRVGATWMTTEERLTDIDDYVNYLNHLYDSILRNPDLNDIKINVLGFSQGAATVCRWLSNRKAKFDSLILWAGIFPPDLPFELCQETFKNKEIKLVYGIKDLFVKQELLNQQKLTMQKLGLNYEVITFDGEHIIDKELLAQLAI